MSILKLSYTTKTQEALMSDTSIRYMQLVLCDWMRKMFFSSLLMLLPFVAFPQISNYSIEVVSEKFGQENYEIDAVCEDDYGFIWVGTKGGIVKYDGLTHRTYTSVERDTATFTLEKIRFVSKYDNKNLLIGANLNGLVRYEYETDRLIAIPFEKGYTFFETATFSRIEVADDKKIWLSYYYGIVVLDSDFKMVEVYAADMFEGVDDNAEIYDIFNSSWGDIYAVSRSYGVYKLDKNTNRFLKFFTLPSDTYSDDYYYSITESPSKTLLVSTFKNSIVEFDQTGSILNGYWIDPDNKDANHCEIWGLTVQDSTLLWGGVNAGVHAAPLNKPEDVSEIPLSINPNNSNAVSVSEIINDKYGNVWVANHRPGLFKINRNAIFTAKFPNEPINWLDGKVVNCIHQYDSVLWIGTDGDGLFYHNVRENTFRNFTTADGLSGNVIMDIVDDSKGNIWLATWGDGLNCMDASTFEVDIFRPDPEAGDKTVSFPSIKNLCFKDDTLWIATHGHGLNLYLPEKDVFVSKNNQELVDYDLTETLWGNKLFVDKNKTVWQGTTMGLFSYKNGKSQVYKTSNTANRLYDDHIFDIYEDSKGRLWIGTLTGLQYFTADRHTIVQIPKDIVENGVYSIIEKSETELFISTVKGLQIFDIEKNKCLTFKLDDGLSSNSFRERSVYKSDDGVVYWGTSNGLSYTADNKKYHSNNELEIMIHSINIASQSDSVLFEKYNFSEDIVCEVSYDHSKVDVHFAAINVPDLHNVKFSHRLIGINNNLQETLESRVSYSKIPSGKYTLVINAEYQDRTYKREIFLIVLPPFWQTWWFYLIEALIALAFFFIIYRLRLRQLKAQKKRLQEQVEKNTIQLKQQHEELSDAYTELKGQSEEMQATNLVLEKTLGNQKELVSVLAHDVKNSFSAVKGFTSLLRKEPSELEKFLSHINNGVDSSTLLLNNLLLWFQSQSDDLVLDFKNHNLADLIEEAVSQNVANAEIKDIAIKSSISDKLEVYVDKNTFVLSIRNLLHNAVKYSFKKSEIIVEAVLKGENLLNLQIVDYGKGMPQQVQDSFNNEKQLKSTIGTSGEVGTGLGLVLVRKYIELNKGEVEVKSIEDSGTEFSILLPYTSNGTSGKRNKKESDLQKKHKFEGLSSDLNKYTVLIVEDNASIRAQVVSAMKDVFTVIEAADGREGLKMVTLHMPDIIITDYMMPKMKGDELAQTLKSSPATAHIPVVMFSAVDEDDYSLKALESGIDSYISKSENPQKLILKVSNIIRTREHFQETLNVSADKKVAGKQKESLKLMDKINMILEQNYSSPSFGVEQLADFVGMDRSNLYRRVKAASSKTPVELLVNFRLEKAMKMLQSKRHSVSDVAYLTGFNAPTYFSTKFKKKYNQTPTEVLSSND